MGIINSTPLKDGYYMPAEYEKHSGTIMIWPVRPGSWPGRGAAAKRVFKEIAEHIAQSEDIYMLVDSGHMKEAKQMLDSRIKLINIDTDDAWARDMCPTFVKNVSGDVRGVSWSFNAWGGEYDGLYMDWEMMIRQQGYSVIRRGLIIMMLRLLCLKEVRYTVMVKALLL